MLSSGEFLHEKYRIEKTLGEGGMGIVYLGWDIELERFVAVKEIKASLPGYDRYIERIKREAKLLAKLNHPNIVILYDLIQCQDNWHIIMEYVEGVTLDKKLELTGALPHQEATPILKQMLAALEHAHKAGVIHRDFKPGNVIIKADGQVKVMDFGLAKFQRTGSMTRSTRSDSEQTGGGTLYYLSPEQVESDGRLADHRSDIYSLGMTCYEILTGYMPLKERKTTVEILNAILRDKFPPPIERNAKVPHELSEITRKAIALKPEKRYQSAAEMLKELEKFDDGQKKIGGPGERRRRRIRLVFEVAGALATVALILTLVTLFAVPDLPLRILRWTGIHSSTKVAIFTEPAGAEIHFKGKFAGKSPLRSRLVDDDTLQISIEESAYFRIDTSLVIKGATDTVLVFMLKPAAIFALVVTPESAEVMIDSTRVLPVERDRLELEVGEHELRIGAQGYIPIHEKIYLRQGLNPTRVDTLKQAMIAALTQPRARHNKMPSTDTTGPADPEPVVSPETTAVDLPVKTRTLALSINPPSEVYIGDSLAARAATRSSFILPLGEHVVQVVHTPLGRWLETIIIHEENLSREIDFTKQYEIRVQAIDANGEPIAAAIVVDGRSAGKSTPDQILLHFGYHQIEVRLEEYVSERRELNVDKNEKLQFRLRRTP